MFFTRALDQTCPAAQPIARVRPGTPAVGTRDSAVPARCEHAASDQDWMPCTTTELMAGSATTRYSFGCHDRAPHRVVIVGGGFGGLQAALKLARHPVEVTLVDRRNFHLFQPLAYQVATGALSPGRDLLPAARDLPRHRNVRVLLAEVTGFDLGVAARRAATGGARHADAASLEYDSLIVAGGLALLLLRPRRVAAARARAQVAGGSARHPQPDPHRVRGGRDGSLTRAAARAR